MRRFCVGEFAGLEQLLWASEFQRLGGCNGPGSTEGEEGEVWERGASRVLEARALCRAKFPKNIGAARCLLAMVIGYRGATSQ